MSVFIDTNVFVAAADAGEARHSRAADILSDLTTQDPFTSDHVVVEVWAIMNRRAGFDIAESFVTALRATPVVLEVVTLADVERALAIGETWSDQRFDLVDRTSMAMMERLGCSRVASFDRDFAVYRFGRDRRSAFEVLT